MESITVLQNRPRHPRIHGGNGHRRAPVSTPLDEVSDPSAQPVLLIPQICHHGACAAYQKRTHVGGGGLIPINAQNLQLMGQIIFFVSDTLINGFVSGLAA
ncbi:hypothetical protein P3T23_005364 [Paraburkholderia sp. GAS448]